MTFFVAAALAALSLAAGYLYRRAWAWRPGRSVTPKGYGALLPLFLLAGGVLLGDSPALLAIYAITAVGGAIYWIDDHSAVSFRIRFALQFLAGAAIGTILLWPLLVAHPAWLAAGILAAALVNIILTNAINFFDGADLNSSTMTVLVALLVLALGPALFFNTALVIVAFVVPFMIWNSVPERLWFGDSGCFVVACLATAVAIESVLAGAKMDLLPLVPVAWAVFDAFVVFLIRVSNKEDLLSRNYHHLYQKMQARFGGWFYLLPQFANVAAVAGVAWLLMRTGLAAPWPITAAAVVATPLIYLSCRAVFAQKASS
jgi:UDP-N-acetylmuramyl pentapeptide phosphotransferase/UDP-N-acetylglucosamine-1-phosphate transferase